MFIGVGRNEFEIVKQKEMSLTSAMHNTLSTHNSIRKDLVD